MFFRTPRGDEKEFDLDMIVKIMSEKGVPAAEALTSLGGDAKWSWAVPDGPTLYHICCGRRIVGKGVNVLALNHVNEFGAAAQLVVNGLTWEEALASVEEAKEEKRRTDEAFANYVRSKEGYKEYLRLEKRMGILADLGSVMYTPLAHDLPPWWRQYKHEQIAKYHRCWIPSAPVLEAMEKRWRQKAVSK